MSFITPHPPLIEICVPVFNGTNFLEDCLRSIQNQTFKDFKCIIVDDNSSDHSRLIAKQFTEHDPRFILNSHVSNSGGFGKAVQESMHTCRATYFSWLAHDDCAHPTFLERSLEYLENNRHIDYAYTDLTLLNEKGGCFGKWDYPKSWEYTAYTKYVYRTLSGKLPMNGVFRVEALVSKGLSWVLHRGESFSSDTITAIDMLWKGLRVGKSNAELCYRIHKSNSSKSTSQRLISDINVIHYIYTYHNDIINKRISIDQMFALRLQKEGLEPSKPSTWNANVRKSLLKSYPEILGTF